MRSRRKKVPDSAVFDAIVRVMLHTDSDGLTLSAIAAEAGLTAGALVQRFGSKREMMLAHARHAATTGDIGLETPSPRRGSALSAIRRTADPFAQLAASPEGALRNLSYLQRDLADPDLHASLREMNRKARKEYQRLVSEAIVAGELRRNTNASTLARTIEVTLIGSFLAWAIYREGSAASWIRKDLNAVLRQHLA
jgi:AcrR family transcriptional regulator